MSAAPVPGAPTASPTPGEQHVTAMTLTTPIPASRRADGLEQLLGPLDDPDNPVGRDAILVADEHWETLGEAEERLREFGLGAELVPLHLGGRLERLDALGRILRPIFRRDPSLGFADGLMGFIASSMVWVEGTEQQRTRLAELLIAGERLTLVRREEAHANDLTREEIHLEQGPDGPVLRGVKSAVANSDRARVLVLMVRDERLGEDARAGYSVIMLDRESSPDTAIEDMDRYPTVGLRGCWFGGLEFIDCPVPEQALVGKAGGAVQLGLRGSLIVRGVVSSTHIASGDVMLRSAARFVDDGGESGIRGTVSGHDATALSGALLDLLIADCITLVACRAPHLVPEDCSACAAAAAYVVPKLLGEVADNLTVVLGNAQFATDGPFGLFQKCVRDLPVTTLGHAGNAGRQATLVTSLPRLAARSWFRATGPDRALFELDGPLPPLPTDRLRGVGDGDALVAALLDDARELAAGTMPGIEAAPDDRQPHLLRELVDVFVAEIEQIREACVEIGEQGKAALLTPRSYALADRYALICAATAALGVWRGQLGGDGDPFLADLRWPLGALTRIGERLGLVLPTRSEEFEEWALDEVFARHEAGESFDLYRSRDAR